MSLSTDRSDRRSSPARARVRDADAIGDRDHTERTNARPAADDENAATAIDALDGPPDRYRMIVPTSGALDSPETDRLARTAATIAGDQGGTVLLVGLVVVPEQAALDQLRPEHPRYETVADAISRSRRVVDGMGVPARSIVCRTRRAASAILGTVEKYNGDGIAMTVPPGSSQRRRLLAGSAVETVAARAGCDVFVEKPATGAEPPVNPPERILLAVAGGPHSGIATDTARSLALPGDARVDVVHFVTDEPDLGTGPGTKVGSEFEPEPMPEFEVEPESDSGTGPEIERGRASDVLRAAERALGDARVESTVRRTDRVAEALVERSGDYDVTVLGAPIRGLLRQLVFGTVPDAVTRRSETRIVMAKRNTGRTSAYDRWIAGDAGSDDERGPEPS